MAIIGLLFNRNAGNNGRDQRRLAALRSAIGPQGVLVATDTLAELPAAARQLADADIDVLAVSGGDGSFFRALSACIPAFGARLPYFLPLPSGTMNTVAKSLGCRRRGLAAMLASLAEARDLGSARTVEREVIRSLAFDAAGQPQPHPYYGFMVGAGVIVNFLAAYYRETGRGPRAASVLALRLIGSMLARGAFAEELFATVDAQVQCQQELLPWSRYSIIFAATIHQLGLGFQVSYRGGSEPGTFHVVAGDPHLDKLVLRLPQILTGRPTRVARVHDELAQHLAIELDKPAPFMIDGDILPPAKRVELSVGPRLRILL